jgi:vacuolar-type H+-ATPase subunit F/Vma7
MKIFCITNNQDLAIEMGLTGVPSLYMKDEKEICAKVDELLKDEDLGILMVSESLFNNTLLPFKNIMETRKIPLVVNIPEDYINKEGGKS